MHPAFALIVLQYVAALFVTVPVALLFIECICSVFPRGGAQAGKERSAPVAVLIPAHDESALIAATIASVLPQLGERDRLIVVADNCTDNTAAVATAAGATVIERVDPHRRGKGYALACGVERLRQSPPEVVIVCDADLVVPPGAIASLTQQVLQTNKAAQAQYILSAEPGADTRQIVSSLAFIVKNIVRPMGLDWMGMSVPLTGTGMAFPWVAIAASRLANGDLVEDMRLGVCMHRTGFGPRLCRSVTIQGSLPGSREAALDQRMRWEHGHLGLLRSASLPLFLEGIRRLRFPLMVAALDCAVPPLALLVLVWLVLMFVSCLTGHFAGVWGPFWLNATAGAMLASAILVACRTHARHLPLSILLGVPLYIAWKLPIYLRFVFKRQTEWLRTPRPVPLDSASPGRR